LLNLDIYCPNDHKTPEAKEAHQTICPGLVAAAVRMVENMKFEKENILHQSSQEVNNYDESDW